MKLKLTPARPAPTSTNPRPSSEQTTTSAPFSVIWSLVQGLVAKPGSISLVR
jgi:hypothetical protein